MSDLIAKLKKRRFFKEKVSFEDRYQHCNRCKIYLNVDCDKEIVCALCGETFCNNCIDKHQQFCYF
ncbi:MAG: hypothetical protein ACFFA0_02825 [Promethearchaeota archaeon]